MAKKTQFVGDLQFVKNRKNKEKMAYKELIKNFSKIRNYLKEFFVYGFNSRGNVGKKSNRSYDDEKRRIQSYLADFIEENHGLDGKTTALSIDVRNVGFNPLYRAWKSASFTDKDITLHFILMDILATKNQITLSTIISIIDKEYLCHFSKMLEFDESTIRKKLTEYEKIGIIKIEKIGNKSVFSLTNNLDLLNHSANALQKSLNFSSEILPLGIIGSTLLDKMESVENCFCFKHHYITQAMDAQIMLTLFDAIRKKCWAEILSYNERKNKKENSRGSVSKVIPLKILSSSQTGRQYLLCHVLKQKKFKAFRLDNIIEVKLLESEPCKDYDAVKKRFKDAEKYRWGASFGDFYKVQTVEFFVKFREDEEHIFKRLVREKRCGKVERISKAEARYFAEVWDAHEMFPWIRTFIMRITELHFSDEMLEKQFWADIYEMRNIYKEKYDF